MATLFSIRPSEVLSKYQGESERFISQIFENAYQIEKGIIFFDGYLFFIYLTYSLIFNILNFNLTF